MDSRELRYFSEIVIAGSFNRASKKLRVSQPALTRCIHDLESELGTKLLDRSISGVSPTTCGALLFDYARSITSEIGRARSQVMGMASASAGSVCIGCLPSQVNGLLPKVSVKLLSTRPGLKLRLVEKARHELFTGLLHGEFDLILSVIDGDESQRHLSSRVLFYDRPNIAFRGGHPLLKSSTAAFNEISQSLHLFPWIVPPDKSSRGHRLQSILKKIGIQKRPNIIIECHSIDFLKATVQQSDCVGFLPNNEILPEEADGRIRSIEIPKAGKRAVGLIYKKEYPITQSMKSVISTFVEVTSAVRK